MPHNHMRGAPLRMLLPKGQVVILWVVLDLCELADLHMHIIGKPLHSTIVFHGYCICSRATKVRPHVVELIGLFVMENCCQLHAQAHAVLRQGVLQSANARDPAVTGTMCWSWENPRESLVGIYFVLGTRDCVCIA